MSDWKVTIPTGELNGVKVDRFTVSEDDSKWSALRDGARYVPPGTYTRLSVNGTLWMTDTRAEFYDHMDAVRQIKKPDTRRVLINGLGIGMVVKAALDQLHVEHVDVVELNENVIALVGPHYTADPRVTIHHADAYTIKWPAGTTWDVAWHDIWADICTDNLPLMARLHRRYGRRVRWQGSWSKEQARYHRNRERRSGWY